MRPVLTRIRAAADVTAAGEELEAWIGRHSVAAVEELGVVTANATVLGVGAGRAPALFALSTRVAQAIVTDRYLGTDLADMLSDAGAHHAGPWDPQRLAVEDMDPAALRLPDESVDIVIGGLSLARTPDRARVVAAVAEIARVLRPGGVASITLQVALDGAGDACADGALTVAELAASVIAPYDWVASDDLDLTLDDATRANPQLVRRGDGHEVVDVHLALQRPVPQPTGSVAPAERPVSGPREAVGALAKHLPDAVVGVDAGVRWGFPDAWEALGAHVRLIGFDPDREECARLAQRYAARIDATLVALALGAQAGTATYRTYAFAGINTMLDPVVPTSAHGDEQPLATEAVQVVTLDAWIAEHDVGRVDALKLDTQGYELEILRGATATLEHVRVIDVEVALNPLFAGGPLLGDVDALLRARGFLLWRLPTLVHHHSPAARPSHLRVDTRYYDGDDHVQPVPTGMVSWADAHYVRADLAGHDDTRDWETALRDAVLANALAHHDLAEIGLRRAIAAGAPPEVAAAIGEAGA